MTHTIPPWAREVADGLVAGGIRDLVYVPDNPLSHLLRAIEADHKGIRTTIATREEEAFGIAAGLYLGGGRPAVLMQSSGLGNAANALASLLVAYQVPVPFVISMRGEEGEWNWAQVPMARAVRPLLQALGIPWFSIESPESAEAMVRKVTTMAFGTRTPAACLLPRHLTVADAVNGGTA
jgi:sulfopyruvate decarboxylase subunit alpha